MLVRSASGRDRLLVAVMALSALLAAVVTPSGAAAALLPVAVLAARRSGLAPARLLMPLAFAASAGALLALSGSPVNVIVSDALLDATGHGFGFFEFALVGVPLTVVTLAVSVLWGDRLLPRRTPGEQPADLSDHLSTVIDHYHLERGFFRAAVRRGRRSSTCARTRWRRPRAWCSSVCNTTVASRGPPTRWRVPATRSR